MEVVALLLAVALKQDQTPLRAACSETAETIATLPKEAPIKIRYALSGSDTPCYAVVADVAGKQVNGYLPAAVLSGLEEFEASRRRAPSVALPSITRPEIPPVPAESRDAALIRASALLERNQPDGALGILQAALRLRPKDPHLLSLAGWASYRLDDPRGARAYWQESLEIRPDPVIEEMLRRLDRETGADKSTQKTFGSRFLLRYDGAVAEPETARNLVAVLEQEFTRVSMALGCQAEERLVTIVQSRESYRAATGAAEWNGGQFDGRIRIPLERARSLDPRTRQTLAHELVHACLATLGRWPTWVHEGLAQKLAGQTLTSRQREDLRESARAGQLPKLGTLGDGWWRLNSDQAAMRYGLALAAVEELFRTQGTIAGRNLLNNSDRLDDVAAGLDRALTAALR
jgi:tetratricopeptide (TPR) repeat protein